MRKDEIQNFEDGKPKLEPKQILCLSHYRDNQCDQPNLVPALESMCKEFQKCMEASPHKQSLSQIIFLKLGQITDDFLSELNNITVMFLFVVLLIYVLMISLKKRTLF